MTILSLRELLQYLYRTSSQVLNAMAIITITEHSHNQSAFGFFFQRGWIFNLTFFYHNIPALAGNCYQYLFFKGKLLKKKSFLDCSNLTNQSFLLNFRGSLLTSTDFSFKDGNNPLSDSFSCLWTDMYRFWHLSKGWSGDRK